MDHSSFPAPADSQTGIPIEQRGAMPKRGLLPPNPTPLEDFPLNKITPAHVPSHLTGVRFPPITLVHPVRTARLGLSSANYFEVRRCSDDRIVYYAWLVSPQLAAKAAIATNILHAQAQAQPGLQLHPSTRTTSAPDSLVFGARPTGWQWIYFCGADHHSINPTQEMNSACAIGQWNPNAIFAHVKQHDLSLITHCPREDCVFGPTGGRSQFANVNQLEHHLFIHHRLSVEEVMVVMEEAKRVMKEKMEQKEKYWYAAFNTRHVVVCQWKSLDLAHPDIVIHTIQNTIQKVTI